MSKNKLKINLMHVFENDKVKSILLKEISKKIKLT